VIEMTCREFDEVVHGLVRMELLDVVVREKALDHAAHCPNCADRMAEARLLAEATESVARNSREQQAPPSVEAALLSDFRSHHRRASWVRRLEWVTAGAVAAMLLVFVWNYQGRTNRDQSSPAPSKDVSSQSKAPLDASVPVLQQPGESTQVAADEVADRVGGEGYAASDFVPVPFTEGIAPEDAGMVVRVQLTRASLAELGYPVAETPGEDLILADVLVGEDGWPRGVKLVP
jgi:hypothetical protein